MAMQAQLWSISALATEFHMDRRTMAKRLEYLPPAETKQIGKRTEKRWRLNDVVAYLNKSPDEIAASQLDEERWQELKRYFGNTVYPNIINDESFIGAIFANTTEKMGLSKHQAVEIYKIACLAVAGGLSRSCDDEDMKIETGEFFSQLIEMGADEYVENHWPEWE